MRSVRAAKHAWPPPQEDMQMAGEDDLTLGIRPCTDAKASETLKGWQASPHIWKR